MTDTVHVLDSYCHPTSDKSVLDSRVLKLEVCLLQEMSLIYGICFSQNFSSLRLPGVIRNPRMGTSLVIQWLGMGTSLVIQWLGICNLLCRGHWLDS